MLLARLLAKGAKFREPCEQSASRTSAPFAAPGRSAALGAHTLTLGLERVPKTVEWPGLV